MLPPPPAEYENAELLFKSIQKFANSEGYGTLVKKRTRKDRQGELKNMTLRCDRGGTYNNISNLTEETRQRSRSTRLINCPFELYAAKYNGIWSFEIRNENHNHDFKKSKVS